MDADKDLRQEEYKDTADRSKADWTILQLKALIRNATELQFWDDVEFFKDELKKREA